MDRVVKQLHGKLYMGSLRTPHYYVQFEDSDKLEFVRCSEVTISNAQKIAFDANFDEDERRAGRVGTATHGHRRHSPSKPLSALNFIAGGSEERVTKNLAALQHNKTVQASHSVTPVLAESEVDEKYESSFINDSTPTAYSSSDFDEENAAKTAPKCKRAKKRIVVVTTKKSRKRVVLDSSDESSSEPSSEPSPLKTIERTSLKQEYIPRICSDSTAAPQSSSSTSKHTPLIILGAGNDATKKRSDVIPVITLE